MFVNPYFQIFKKKKKNITIIIIFLRKLPLIIAKENLVMYSSIIQLVINILCYETLVKN